MTTDRTWPSASCSWKSPNCGLDDSLGPGLMSFWAKNASTTTMRIGNAALLKNLLMRRIGAPRGAVDQQYQGGIGRPGGRLQPFFASDVVFPWLCALQRRHVRQVAVVLVVVEPVADREPVGNLESDVAGLELD